MNVGVLDLASSLISIDSTNPRAMELEIADWLGDVLEELGFSVIRQKFNESRMNLFAFKRPEMVKLLLCGHLDTVPPTEGWKENPFVPKVKRGKLIGLGACDMKGAIATMIVAGMEAISESDEVGVGLLFTSDEEVGMSGARMAASRVKDTFRELKLCLIGEPTDLKLVTCHKGSLKANLKVKGVAAHSSIPESGSNAIHSGIKILKEMIEKGIPSIEHPLLGKPTLQVTIVRGGVAENIIPDKFEAKIDMRLVPPETDETRKSLLMDIIRENKDVNAVIEFGPYFPPYEAPLLPEVDLIARVMESIGLDSRTCGVPYMTEASVYWMAGIPSVVIGPGDIKQAHKPNESVYVSKLALAKKLYKKLILALNGPHQP